MRRAGAWRDRGEGQRSSGNVSADSDAVTVVVDATSPGTTIMGGQSGTTDSASANFTFSSAEGGATFECKVDDAAFAACGSGTYTGLSNGPHAFEVRATDAAGNTDATPASRTWTIDTTPPTPPRPR